MPSRRMPRNLGTAVGLVLAAGLPLTAASARMDALKALPGSLGSRQPEGGSALPVEPGGIRFNFSGTPWSEVLAFFARESGLPVIREGAVPPGGMDFISSERYSFAEALSILNLSLNIHGVHLRREGDFLFLASIQDSMRRPGPVIRGEIPEDITPDQIVTIMIPLSNAVAKQVLPQIAPLVGPYGGIHAVDIQNMLVVVETAARCRRIREIVHAIDAAPAIDRDLKVFPLRHASPDEVVAALRNLVGIRTVTQLVDPNTGQRTTLEDVNVAGVNLQADNRSRSVIAIGPASRVATVAELIPILDGPGGGVGGEMRMNTFPLRGVSAGLAAERLESLFRGIAAERRPTVLPLIEAGKVTVVGPEALLLQAAALLSEIDPPETGGDATVRPERESRTIRLRHASPDDVERIASRLLSARQREVLQYTALRDQRGIMVVGPGSDIEAFEALVSGLDIPAQTDREVRVLHLDSQDAAALVERARGLLQQTAREGTPALTVNHDARTRTLTLVGSRAEITRFEGILRNVQEASIVRETRTYRLENARASALATQLDRLAQRMLRPSDGSAYVAPVFEALDDLQTLMVRAEPAHFLVLDTLVQRLDRERPPETQFQIVRAPRTRDGDVQAVVDRAQDVYAQRSRGMAPAEVGPVSVEYDAVSGSLLLQGRAGALRLFTEVLTQVQQLVPPERTTRILELRNVRAADVVGPLMDLLEGADPIDPSRAVPPPLVRAVERNNSLLVSAEDAQHQIVADFVRRLDVLEPAELPPLKLLQLRTADGTAIASMLNDQYSRRPQSERLAMPVEVRADAATNTLIVSAHADLFDEIRSFVDDLNRGLDGGPERVTELFTLTVARAEDVARAMDRLYPQPPMPVDRLNRPMPWAQEPKEVNVSADPSSNSLIIDAPAERMESLRALAAKLDRVEVPPMAELRSYRVVGADLGAISQTLQALAGQGNLAGPARAGRQAVRVVIQTEPRSSTLIVAGDEVTFERVEQILADLSAVPVERGLRIVPIANAEAAAVRDRAVEIYDAQVAQIPTARPVDVTVDADSNSLMVVADAESMQRFLRVVEELQRQAGPAREIRLIDLRLARATEVVGFLEDLVRSSASFRIGGGADPVFEAIEATNQLMVAAQPGQLSLIDALARNLDSQQSVDRPPLRILRLRATDAPSLASVLNRTYNQRPVEQRARLPVEVQADDVTNTLIVSAHPDMLAEIEGIVRQLNESPLQDAEGREIRIFPLRYARADELARTIDQMFPEPPVPMDPRGRPMPHLRQTREVVVRADRGTNALIVDAPVARLAGFQQIVESLDQRNVEEGIELRSYRLRRADPGAVVSTIRSLASSGALQAAQRPVTVDLEPVSRTLVVSGPAEIFGQVERVLENLDGPADGPSTALRLYRLQHARAESLRPLLGQLLVSRLREDRAAGAGLVEIERLIDVAADRATNTLIISAPEPLLPVAEELIRALDTERAAVGRNVVRVVPLTYADAGQVAGTLVQAIASMDLPSGERPTVLASGGNALVLSGAEADLRKIQELIEPLDARPIDSDTPAVETFALLHTEAAAIAPTVQRLLADQSQVDIRLLQLQVRYGDRSRLFGPPPVRVEAEPGTNALIVSAPVGTIDMARRIIERLDQPREAADQTALVFTPRRGEPARLSQTVLRMVSATLPQGRRPLELLPDAASGSIVILGTAAQVAEAARLLAEFDDRAVAMPDAQIQAFDLSSADAGSVAPMVQSMLQDRTRWPEPLRQAERAGLPIPTPTASADRASNRLVVSAPGLLMPVVTSLVETLDRAPAGDAVEVSVFRLTRGDAARAATAIRAALEAGRRPGRPAPVVNADAASNTLVIAASAEQMATARELVRGVDQAVEPSGVGVRTVFLANARAEAVAPIVEGVLRRRTEVPEQVRRNAWWMDPALLSGEPEVRVAAEPRLNAVVVSAPAAILELAEQLVRELDLSPRGPEGARLVRVIPVTNADAAALAQSVSAVFAEEAAGEQPPVVRVDAGSNALIVRASEGQMARIEGLVRQIDAATISSSRQMRTVPIDRSRADAAAMAQTIRQILEQRGGVRVEVISAEDLMRRPSDDKPGRTKGRGSVVWSSVPGLARPVAAASNAPVPRGATARAMADDYAPIPTVARAAASSVSAALWLEFGAEPDDRPASSTSRAASLMWGVEVPAEAGVVPPSGGVLEAKHAPQAAERDGAAVGVPAVGASVGATARQPESPSVQELRSEVGSVTIAVDPRTNSLLVIGSPRLTDQIAALAAELAEQIPPEPSVVRVVGLPATADARAIHEIVGQTIRQIGRASAQNPGGFTGAVASAPDPSGGSLVVWANDTDFEVLRELIAAVAVPAPMADLTVKLYPLRTLTARQATQAVRDLLGVQPSGRQAQRMLSLSLADDPALARTFDPSLVRVTADPGGAGLVVTAPATTFPLLDRFIALIDQTSTAGRLSIRQYPLANARAEDLSPTMRTLFAAWAEDSASQTRPTFVADARTNAMFVTASDDQHAEVQRLLAAADAEMLEPDLQLAIITLQQASPTTVQRIVEQVIIGRDPARRERVQISAQNDSALFVVRAPAAELAQIREIVAEVDTAETTGLPVRTIRLQRADAQAVSRALQQFFAARASASSSPGRRVENRVAITGDRQSGVLVIAASDEDFAQMESMIADFDAPAEHREMVYRIIRLENARAADVRSTVSNIQWTMFDERVWSPRAGSQDQMQDRLYLSVNTRLNAVIAVGQGETIDLVEGVIRALDVPMSRVGAQTVRSVPVDGTADLNAIASTIRQAMRNPELWEWEPDPEGVTVQVDQARRLIILVGPGGKVDQASEFVAELAREPDRAGRVVTSISLAYANADAAARSLGQFFRDRNRAAGRPIESVSIIGSREGNVLLVSADEASMPLLREMVAQVDRPEMGSDRTIEVYALRNARAPELAETLRAMFPRSSRPEEQVIVTPQSSSNALIVSSPRTMLAQVDTLIAQLDAPPTEARSSITTVGLSSARASEVARALESALPRSVQVTITPVERSNSLLLSGSEEAIALAMRQIEALDQEPVRSLREFRRVVLHHALSRDVAMSLRALLRTRAFDTGSANIESSASDNTILLSAPSDQIEEIVRMIGELDVSPADGRVTDFVRLEFARAEQTAKALEVFYGRFATAAETPGARNVTIVADPASNSLVISAGRDEWEGIRSLLRRLDTAEYDTARQLVLIPLRHADAASVARTLNEGFRAPLEQEFAREQARRQQDQQRRGAAEAGQQPAGPPVLIAPEDTPSVSAEVQTNSLVVFASRPDIERIRALVEQIDVPGFARLPAAHIVPISTGRAQDVAAAVREVYVTPRGRDAAGSRSVLVWGDAATNTVIVRASEEEFEAIRALIGALQSEGSQTAATPRILRLTSTPAVRLRDTLRTTFAPIAQQRGQPLAIEADRAGNALIVSAAPDLFEQIEQVARELDAMSPRLGDPGGAIGGVGQSVFIIDVQNNDPAAVRQMLEQMGVTRPATGDRQGLVGEPVSIIPMVSRRALAVVASPADGPTIVALVRALDAQPAGAEQAVAAVPLRMAAAGPVVQTLRAMLDTTTGASGASPAAALAEHVRRLRLGGAGQNHADVQIDLSQPIRLIPDAASNTVVVASTEANVRAISDVIRLLDTLPVGDAVVVRLFPLENAAATRVKTVIDELFRQGEQIRRLPGTTRQGLPSTTTGRALAGDVAVSIDERTNALVVAGREEAVALVEVLVQQLDSDAAANWVEPVVITLKHADAVRLGRTLQAVLVSGSQANPEASAIARQFARLRMARQGADPRQVIEADIFRPVAGLVITPEESLNALIVVGTPANAQVVRELVAMLDVEAAAESNTVRMFPLAHASADRVSTILSDVFRQREQAGTTRPEDRLVVTPDLRTNTLVISTSPRSFEIVHSMLQTLDVAEASPAVGLHVIRVDGVDVSALAPRLQNLMRERLEAERRAGGRASPADVFRVEADAANGALIVAASQENLRVINDLIAALVEAGGGTLPEDLRTEIIQANHSRASDLADAIQNLYVSREVQRRGERAVSVIANQRLNALVVSGTDADIAAVRALVDRLDLERVNITQVLDRIELRSANALEVVSLLRAVLAGRPITGRAPSPAERAVHLNYRDQIAEASLDGAILDLVRVEPDLRTNSVVVNAPKPVLELIRAIVIDLDTTRAGERDIRRFRLVNADAEAMGVLLRDLFNLRQQGDAYVLIPTGSGAMPGDDPAMPDMGFGTRVTPVPDQRQQLAITVDPRTNTLIVSGTPEYLDLVQEVVSELDSIEANSRERVVIPLRNAKSADIETVLQNYFRTEADRIRSVLGDQAGSTARQLEQEVTIVGDPSSNQILISASPRYISTVTQIVRELDAPPPQVMIQVLIAEVTIDRERDWGMDFSAGPFGGSMTSINSNPAGAAISSALGVPNFSVSSADFGLMIRALQSQGRLEVLSRPHLTVNNNETAEFNAGEDIAIVTSVDNLDNGRTRANVERRVVGVILNVTPTISGDGFVRLDIAPVISALSQRTTEISEDFSAPIITERRVSTTVTVRDGETVVIGGLLQTRDEDRETRVPILGEIPGIGSIFRTTRRNQTKTELLLILTPRVIVGQSAEDVERLRTLSQEHINRLSNPDAINRMLRDSRDRAEGMGAAAPGALSPPSDSRRSEPRMIIRPGQQ